MKLGINSRKDSRKTELSPTLKVENITLMIEHMHHKYCFPPQAKHLELFFGLVLCICNVMVSHHERRPICACVKSKLSYFLTLH